METDYEKEQYGSSRMRYANILFKNKKASLTLLVLMASLATLIAFVGQPVYEAKSSVLVKMGREYLVRPELGDRIPPTMSVNQDGIISSELQILSSKELRDRVVAEVKPLALYPDLQAVDDGSDPKDVAAARLEKALKFSKVKNSNVIEISFQHTDPKTAAQVVNLLVDHFREKHLQVFREPQSMFLQQQLDKYTEKLVASQNALELFKEKNDVFSLEEQRTLLLRQKTDMDAALQKNNNEISEMEKKVSTLRKQLQAVYKSQDSYTLPENNNNIQDAKAKLLSLMLEQQQLSRKYTPSNKLVVNSKNEIEVVQKFINELENEAKTKAKTGNQIYLDLYREFLISEATMNSLVSKGISIKSQLNEVKSELKYINQSELQLENLKREKLMNEKNYQVYLDRLEESRMLDEMNRQKLANISVIQEAAVPVKPASMSRERVVFIGLLCGFFAALAGAFLIEKVDQRFATPDKVEKVLGIPVLVSIPYH